jgi:hypothetical protein
MGIQIHFLLYRFKMEILNSDYDLNDTHIYSQINIIYSVEKLRDICRELRLMCAYHLIREIC